jgi:hypothetical protein
MHEGESRHYEEPLRLSKDDIHAALARNDPEELLLVPISVSMEHDDLLWSQALCVQLAKHGHYNVRGNAVLGFGHLARRFRNLDEEVVRPIIEQALVDSDSFVRGQAWAAAEDVAFFLGWKVEGFRDSKGG